MGDNTRNELKSYFVTGAVPTQSQFAGLIDSAVNKADDGIAVDAVQRIALGAAAPTAKLSVSGGLDAALTGTATVAAGEKSVKGTGTKFKTELQKEAAVVIGQTRFIVEQIVDDLEMTVTEAAVQAISSAAMYIAGPLFDVKDAADSVQLLIDPLGNVGLGGVTPTARLHVKGTVIADAFQGSGAGLTHLNPAQLDGQITSAQIADLEASKVTGTLAADQLPDIPAAKITGELSATQLPDIPAAKITGELSATQLPDIPAAKITGELSATQLPDIPAAKVTGELSATQLPDIPAAKITGELSATQLPDIPAAKITGELSATQLPDIPAAKIAGPLAATQLPDIPAAKIAGPLAATQLPDIPAAKIAGPLSATQLPDIPAAKIAGPLAATQLPDIPAAKITGPLSATQLPDIPAAKIAGPLSATQLPDIPAAKIAGLLSATQLPDIPAAKIAGPLSATQLPDIPAAKIAGPLALTQLPDIPASKVTGLPAGGGLAIWAQQVALVAQGLSLTASSQASGAADGVVIGLLKTVTSTSRTLYALGIGFPRQLLDFRSLEFAASGLVWNAYADRTTYALSKEGGAANETASSVQFVGVDSALSFNLLTPESQLPASSQGKIRSLVTIGTTPIVTAQLPPRGGADIAATLRSKLSMFSYVAFACPGAPDAPTIDTVTQLAQQLHAQGLSAQDAAGAIVARLPRLAAGTGISSLLQLMAAKFPETTSTPAQMAWMLGAAGCASTDASKALAQYYGSSLSANKLLEVCLGPYPVPTVQQAAIALQEQGATAQAAATQLRTSLGPYQNLPLEFGIFLRLYFAATSSTPLQLAQSCQNAGFTSSADVTAALQQLFPGQTAAITAAVRQIYGT